MKLSKMFNNPKPETLVGFSGFSRYPSSTLFPLFVWGLLSKAEHWDKGHPFSYGATAEPSFKTCCADQAFSPDIVGGLTA